MASVSYEVFLENLPEFKKHEEKMTPSLIKAFSRWVEMISGEGFDASKASDTDEGRIYAQCLYVAHVARLNWLPRNEIVPAILIGDGASQGGSEGGVSFSFSRIAYSAFLTDPYLSLTSYGSELAHMLRSKGGIAISVL